MNERLLSAIRERLPGLEVLEREPLKNHTSFRIGGPAALVLLPASVPELKALCALLRELGEEPLILGNGSNVLAPDEGLERAVIVTRRVCGMAVSGESITAECGVSLTKVSGLAAQSGLTGLEFAYGIPGTLGGALIMNAGAYGGEMRDVTAWVEWLDGDLTEHRSEGPELDFGYRRSRFRAGETVLRAGLRLSPGDAGEIQARCRELTEKRRASQPLDLPSAGSAFKRPKEGYAAALIDEAGLKGYAVGGARVSEKHAGFIVNGGNATAHDVRRLMEEVRERVRERTGIELEAEIRIL